MGHRYIWKNQITFRSMDEKVKHYVVSIIIPTYNVEAYIRECLESVAAQTYRGEIECIIVDDCGTDKSIEEAERFIAEYRGNVDFRILHRKVNGGLSAARNSGTDSAKGDYIYYLDSDDKITTTCIEEFVSVARKYPQTDVIQGGISDMKKSVISDVKNIDLPDFICDVRTIKEKYMLNYGLPIAAYSRLYNKSFLNDNHLRFHEGIIHEDVPFTFLLAQRAKCIAICRHNSYLYRIMRQGSIVNSSSKEYAFSSRMTAMNDCIDSINATEKDIQVRGIITKILCYLAVTEPVFLQRDSFSTICSKVAMLVSFPLSLVLNTYFLLPINFQRAKIFRYIISIICDIKL